MVRGFANEKPNGFIVKSIETDFSFSSEWKDEMISQNLKPIKPFTFVCATGPFNGKKSFDYKESVLEKFAVYLKKETPSLAILVSNFL